MSRRSPGRLLLAALACAVTLASAQPAAAAPTKAERTLLRAVNNVRAAHGLSRLRFGATLQTGAHRWASYLLRHDVFVHGRLGVGTSENLAWLTCRSGWAGQVVGSWLASPAHRVNLLDRSARRAGIGVARGGWTVFPCVRMAVARFR